MRVAITREVSSSLGRCELTHLERRPIDIAAARAQHASYREALATLADEVITLPPLDDHPDAVFVEDPAFVLDELAIITRPGAASRRAERRSLKEALEPYRPLAEISAPGTLEGGDIVRLGRRLYVGRSSRTNDEGMAQLAALATPHGYEVLPVAVTGCLHLKSACCALDDRRVLGNPDWFDDAALTGIELVGVPTSEPAAANVLVVEDRVVLPAGHTSTAELLAGLGFSVISVDVSELLKAESGVTCSSLVFEA